MKIVFNRVGFFLLFFKNNNVFAAGSLYLYKFRITIHFFYSKDLLIKSRRKFYIFYGKCDMCETKCFYHSPSLLIRGNYCIFLRFEYMNFKTGLSFAQQLDAADPLKSFRDKFIIPEADGNLQIYFLGNSLGLQPRSANGYIQQILSDWASLGVESF